MSIQYAIINDGWGYTTNNIVEQCLQCFSMDAGRDYMTRQDATQRKGLLCDIGT